MSKNIKKTPHNLGTEKEWSFHSPFHLCKGFLPPFVRHCRWRKTTVALCSASSEGQTVKVGNPSSPFQFKCNISASLGRVSTATFLLSGHLLCDFQVKRKEEETQLEEVDIYPPPKVRYQEAAACHTCVCARASGAGVGGWGCTFGVDMWVLLVVAFRFLRVLFLLYFNVLDYLIWGCFWCLLIDTLMFICLFPLCVI